MGSVFANTREVSAKKDANKSIAAPVSVCLSPPSPPAGPIPIPYPVTDTASNTTDGTGSVYIERKEVGKKNGSNYKKCSGNEPATRTFGMDVVSHTIQGKTKFEAYSFDVMFEKAGAERFMDFTSTNHMNPATAFTASAAGAAPPGGPNQDDCEALGEKNKEFREKNDDAAIKTKEDGTNVTFGESGTVSNGSFLRSGSSSGTSMAGCSATGQLQAANQNLCSPTSTVASTTVPKDPQGVTKKYIDDKQGLNKKLDRVGKEYDPVASTYKFPFCPGNEYEHPAGGLEAHAELNILNNIQQPTTKADKLLLNIDWNHGKKKGDDKPCKNCQKAIAAACECMTIYVCDKKKKAPVDRCEKPYQKDGGAAGATGKIG